MKKAVAGTRTEAAPVAANLKELNEFIDQLLWCVLEDETSSLTGSFGGATRLQGSFSSSADLDTCDMLLAKLIESAKPSASTQSFSLNLAEFIAPAVRILRLHPTATVVKASGKEAWQRGLLPLLPKMHALIWQRVIRFVFIEVEAVGAIHYARELSSLAVSQLKLKDNACSAAIFDLCSCICRDPTLFNSAFGSTFVSQVAEAAREALAVRAAELAALIQTAHSSIEKGHTAPTTDKKQKKPQSDRDHLQTQWTEISNRISNCFSLYQQTWFVWRAGSCLTPKDYAASLSLHAKLLWVVMAHRPLYASACPSYDGLILEAIAIIPEALTNFQPAYIAPAFPLLVRLIVEAGRAHNAPIRAASIDALKRLELVIHPRAKGPASIRISEAESELVTDAFLVADLAKAVEMTVEPVIEADPVDDESLASEEGTAATAVTATAIASTTVTTATSSISTLAPITKEVPFTVEPVEVKPIQAIPFKASQPAPAMLTSKPISSLPLKRPTPAAEDADEDDYLPPINLDHGPDSE